MSGSTIFKYTGPVVSYTVPTTDYYDIIAYGTQGGATAPNRFGEGDSRGPGGRGAEIGGDVLLIAGEQLTIAVGGAGAAGFGSVGGGSSFVVGPDNTPLMVAGGGGGAQAWGGRADAQVRTEGGNGQACGGTGGVAGNGGDGSVDSWAASVAGYGAGGDGFKSNGGSSSPSSSSPFGGDTSFLDGGAGGEGYEGGNGGFGGGGGGGEFGGGWSGSYSGGVGGGSFDGGTNQVLVAGENNGNGMAVITPIPQPATSVSVDSSNIFDPRFGNKLYDSPFAGLMKFNLPVQANRIDDNGTFTLLFPQQDNFWTGEFETTLSIYQLNAPYDPATGLTSGGTTPTQVGHALDTETAIILRYVTTSVTFTIPEATLRQWASDPATNYGLMLVESPSLERDAETVGYSVIDWIGLGSSAPTLTFSMATAPPVVVPETLGATYGTPITYSASQLLAGDTDSEGGTLGITAVSGDGVVLNKDGSVTYTPPSTAVPGDTAAFSYTVTDPAGLSSNANATVGLSEANLLANGNFEAKTNDSAVIPSWVTTPETDLASSQGYDNPLVGGFGDSGTGNFVTFSVGERPGGTLSQTFSTTPGQTYSLTFLYGAFGGLTQSLEVSASDALNTANILLDKTVTSAATINLSSLFSPYTYQFTATSTSTTLTFKDVSLSGVSTDGLLDSVDVEPATPTAITGSVTVFDTDPTATTLASGQSVTPFQNLAIADTVLTETISAAVTVPSGFTVTLANGFTDNNGTLSISGTAAQVQAAIDTLSVQSPSVGNGTISVSVTDATGTQVYDSSFVGTVPPQPPVVVNETGFTTPYDSQITLTQAQLLNGDIDPQGGTLAVTAVSDGAVLNPDGTVTLTAPSSSVPGNTASFGFTVTDSAELSSNATATIELTSPLLVSTISIPSSDQNQVTTGTAPVTPFRGVLISYTNPDGTETLTVTPSSSISGTLSDPNAETDGSTVDNSTGAITLTGSASMVQDDLRALVFTPAFSQFGTTNFSIADINSVDPNQSGTGTASVTVNPPTAAQLKQLGADLIQFYADISATNADASKLATDLSTFGLSQAKLGQLLGQTLTAATLGTDIVGLYYPKITTDLTHGGQSLTTDLTAMVGTTVAAAAGDLLQLRGGVGAALAGTVSDLSRLL